MSSFDIVHQDRVVGNLCMFDRMIFKGHLTRLYPPEAFGAFLTRQGVLFKDFKPYVQAQTATLKAHAQRLAADAGRPYAWLQSSTTRRQGRSKEDVARDIAARDGVVEGLVCVLGVLEPATTFTVRGNPATHQLEVARKSTRCTHFYYYFIDRELGWLHVKLQSWLPLQIQIWINGHEWLARRLDRAGIAYTRQGNALTSCGDLRAAQRLCLRFAHRRWPRLLGALARKVNPLLPAIGRAGGGSYYWVLDQAEVATDTVFGDRAALEAVLPDLFDHATVAVGADDIMRFLGRKLHGNFAGEVTTDRRRRREGIRVKHTLNRNSIKIYDKANVLRVETTINNPREFKVARQVDTPDGPTRRWCRMGKGVANTWRYFQCGRGANTRYLDSLATAVIHGEGIRALDALCRPRIRNGRRHARFRPLEPDDAALFAAVLAGAHAITGVRNRDLVARLYPHPPRDAVEQRRRCARVSRQIAKLRGHGLLAKVKDARLYRPTDHGLRVMTAALQLRQRQFPHAYATAAT